jgi:hypothetical protein
LVDYVIKIYLLNNGELNAFARCTSHFEFHELIGHFILSSP